MMARRTFLSVVAVGLLFALTMGLTMAQEASPSAGETEPQGDLSLTSIVGSTISYQGKLTEDGAAVDGSRSMVFRLYGDDGCSTQVGGDISIGTIPVSDGFFNVDIPVDHDDFNGQALWLEAEIGGTRMGCEEIQPVPYALGLRPMATISTDFLRHPHLQGTWGSSSAWTLGDLEFSGMPPALHSIYGVRGHAPGGTADAFGVEGTAETTNGKAYGVYGTATATDMGGISYGVYGLGSASGVCGESDSSNGGAGLRGKASASSGLNYGVDGRTTSAEGYGGFFANSAGGVAIGAGGSGIIKSTAETEIAVSPLKMIPETSPFLNLTIADNGYVNAQVSEAGPTFSVYVPVDLPSVVFGTEQKVKSLRVCYKANGSTSIGATAVRYTEDDGDYVNLINNTQSRSNPYWCCYTVTDPTPSVINGSLFIRLRLVGSGSIDIGKTTLTLVE